MKYLLIALSIIAAAGAQVIIKSSSLYPLYSKKWLITFILSICCYAIAFCLQTVLVRHFPLSKIGPSMGISIMLLVFIAGIIVFGETTQTKQIIGIFLGMIATYLILS